MIQPFSLELARPLATADGTVEERGGYLFARDGGVGEATPLRGWTESLEDCVEALLAADHAADWTGAIDACEGTPAARHAVSLARLDARATAAGDPLAAHLADGDYAEFVPVNATVGDSDAAATRDAVRTAAEEGYGTVKVKVGARSLDADVERVRVAAEAADVVLRVDANGAWSREQAADALDALAAMDADVEYVEQPLPAGDLDGLRDLAAASSGVDLALDEALLAHDLDSVLEVADYAVLKPMALGGVDRARDAAMRARDAGVEPVVSTTVDAVVARTAAVHLAATIPDVPACGLATASLLAEDLTEDATPVVDGRIPVLDAPGHGVEVTPDA